MSLTGSKDVAEMRKTLGRVYPRAFRAEGRMVLAGLIWPILEVNGCKTTIGLLTGHLGMQDGMEERMESKTRDYEVK